MVDLTKLQSNYEYNAFKNNNERTGSFNITGTVSAVTTTLTTIVTLPFVPDLAEIMFQGQNDSFDFGLEPRPSSAWFKRGYVYAPGTDVPAGYTNIAVPFLLSGELSGNTLTIRAQTFKTFVASLVLTPITVQYKVVDYSVF